LHNSAYGKLSINAKTDRPPRITITGPDGKELLSKVMEYG
jgi:hypothetical protein